MSDAMCRRVRYGNHSVIQPRPQIRWLTPGVAIFRRATIRRGGFYPGTVELRDYFSSINTFL